MTDHFQEIDFKIPNIYVYEEDKNISYTCLPTAGLTFHNNIHPYL